MLCARAAKRGNVYLQFTSDYEDITRTVKETVTVYVQLNGDGNAVSFHMQGGC